MTDLILSKDPDGTTILYNEDGTEAARIKFPNGQSYLVQLVLIPTFKQKDLNNELT